MAPENKPVQQHDPIAALRIRDYQLFFVGYVLSTVGYQMQSVAIAWELYERTSSALVLGAVGLVQVIPVIALTLFAGQVADCCNRKFIMMGTQVIFAVCSVGLAILSAMQGSIALIYGCLLLNGVAKAFNQPASDALVPQLVPLSIFGNAVTWNSSASQLATVIGPTLGGAAIALQHSATSVYVVDAILSLARFFLLALIAHQASVRLAEPPSVKPLTSGIQFVWNNQLILAAIALDLFAVLLGGAVTLLPIFAKDILQVGASGLGWLRAAPSVGAVAMAIVLAHRPPLQRVGKTLLWSVAGFGAVTAVFGISRSFWLSMLMLALSGAFNNISVVIRHTLVQMQTPDYLRGRVSAVNTVFISTSNELGSFESGLAAALFGPVIAATGGGIGAIAVALIVALTAPQLRSLNSLKQETLASH